MDENKIDGFNLELIDEISQSKDGAKLFRLSDNSAFAIALHQILVKLYEENPNKLNEHQMNLFLSMHLENSGQSCGILGCLQEWFPQYINKFVFALREIKAPRSAEAIEKAINLLPRDGSLFFDSSNKTEDELMSKFDKEFSNYPDGNMPSLYRNYAEKHKEKILNFEKTK